MFAGGDEVVNQYRLYDVTLRAVEERWRDSQGLQVQQWSPD